MKWVSEDEGDDNEEDLDCPLVSLPEHHRIPIRKSWKRTLVIKLLGRTIGFHVLHMKITEL